ncbi:hypothetical protein M758_UG341900 [Ceratodon purpureus]|nr:hypothetical protein M758_UG341900 [Ceratodon purpureus]
MIWLTCQGGLPLAQWRKRLGSDGICNLCHTRGLETLCHTFSSCISVREVWTRYWELREKAGMPSILMSWFEILTRLDKPLGQPNQIPPAPIPDAGNYYTDTVGKPWDILRVCIIWSIWCVKCGHDLRDKKFHLDLAIFKAWQLTVQSVMGAWRELLKYAKHPKSEKQRGRENHFKTIWSNGGVFLKLKGDKLHWKIVPNMHFLPKNLANKLRNLPRPIDEESSGGDQMLSNSGDTSFTPLSQDLSASSSDAHGSAERPSAVDIDRHAEDIIDQIMLDLIPSYDLGTVTPGSQSDPVSSEHDKDSSEDGLSLADDLQDAMNLDLLVRFWTQGRWFSLLLGF